MIANNNENQANGGEAKAKPGLTAIQFTDA
jgi:hypothetical protein